MHSSWIVLCSCLQSKAADTISVSEHWRWVRSGRAISKKISSSVGVWFRVASSIIGRRGMRMLLITCALVLVRVMLVCSMGCHEGYGEGDGFFLVVSQGFISDFFCQRLIPFPEFCSQLRGMYIIHSLPDVMCVRVSDPPDSILELFGLSEAPCSHDLLHFPFWFTFYDVWGWLVVVRSVLLHLLIWG